MNLHILWFKKYLPMQFLLRLCGFYNNIYSDQSRKLKDLPCKPQEFNWKHLNFNTARRLQTTDSLSFTSSVETSEYTLKTQRYC